ncbi:hypothetical protein GGI25_001847 [Coemansia spiralis]|uniref:Uncharacterized protein n=2 Tax=Coemansia TaxID=4863 RepID=A0A9W8KZP4_9FUNG|nr:hypothetical protein EDC05_001858 [Coemansia umbellata]KAJ2622712.1 hypothetical protein GGI26_002981 [Coemansia sp. RSA 1358]KAJ2679075.1 hypothetical protein GGI25_001847 [Coemansia spiralis]
MSAEHQPEHTRHTRPPHPPTPQTDSAFDNFWDRLVAAETSRLHPAAQHAGAQPTADESEWTFVMRPLIGAAHIEPRAQRLASNARHVQTGTPGLSVGPGYDFSYEEYAMEDGLEAHIDDEAGSLWASSQRAQPSRLPSAVLVHQPWNAGVAWKPYVYQQPVANSLAQVRNANEAFRHRALPGMDADRSKYYIVSSGVHALPLECTSADDWGRNTVDNIFSLTTSAYISTRPRNVHLELSLNSCCVVERILIRSSMTSPPCCELMVFASTRRCSFDELSRFDDFTFAKYEQAAMNGGFGLAEPLPIAYFWLSEEEEYHQLQILPQGVCCKYLYLKLLRGMRPSRLMSLRLVRVYGWSGSRAFSDTTIC